MMRSQTMGVPKVMKIEDIHRYETCMFWIERLAILALLLFPSTTELQSISVFAALTLFLTNLFYLHLSVERQFIRLYFFEPDDLFYIERPAILIELLRYVLPEHAQAPAAPFFSFTVFVLTNFVMLNRYNYKTSLKGKNLAKNSSSNSSQIKTTNAKETSKDIDQKKEENAKGELLQEKKGALKQGVEGLKKAKTMGGSNIAEKSKTNGADWFSSYFPILDSSMAASGNKEEALQMNSTPMIETNNPNALETSKEESELCMLEERETSYASKEVKAEDGKDVSTVMVDGLNSGNDDIFTLYFGSSRAYYANNEGITHEIAEAKDEVQVATGSKHYKSDDDSGWEEVQGTCPDGKLCAEIAHEINDGENGKIDVNRKPSASSVVISLSATSSLGGDETSSWEDGESIDLNRKLSAASADSMDSSQEEKLLNEKMSTTDSLDFLREQLHIYEAIPVQWEQEKKYLINELKRKFLGVDKFNFKAELDAATEELEHYRAIEKDFSKDRQKWNEEKEDLHSKLNAATESLQEERVKWEDERGELLQKLETTATDLERYKEQEKGFTDERMKLEEEIEALKATVTHADENVQYCQTLVNIYAEHCRMLGIRNVAGDHFNREDELRKLKEERDNLNAKINESNSFVESYKAWYDQSLEYCASYYKAYFEENEEKYRKLKEENADTSAKLFTETSFAERYKRLVNELEDKCRKLEEEKIELTAKLCAAKASSELYRACLLDFPS